MPRIELVSAVKSKLERATPLRNRYEQGRVHHVGSLPLLESQLTTWVPGETDSPDRLDACVHALAHVDEGGLGVVDVASAARREHRGGRAPVALPAGYGSRR